MTGMQDEQEGKDVKISKQVEIISAIEIELNELKLQIISIENTIIEGYTDDDILDLRELLDKINKDIESLKNNRRRQDEYYAIRK